MAKTNKIARYVKEPPVPQRAMARSANPKPNGLYLLELRFRHAETQSPLPKRKFAISLTPRDSADDAPKQIKIRFT
jgi:hypothetical protein